MTPKDTLPSSVPLLKNPTNDPLRHFYMELKQTANKPEKMFNILAIKEMQIDATLRYHFTGTRMTRTKESDHSKRW